MEDKLKELGLTADEVMRLAAKTSHPAGNRRYHGLVFRVRGSFIESVTDTAPARFMAIEECPGCGGEGKVYVDDAEGIEPYVNCSQCHGTGEVKVWRTEKAV